MTVTELFPGASSAVRETEHIPVESILKGAAEARLSSVVVVGRDMNGHLYIAGSHNADSQLALLIRGTAFLAETEDVGIIDDEAG